MRIIKNTSYFFLFNFVYLFSTNFSHGTNIEFQLSNYLSQLFPGPITGQDNSFSPIKTLHKRVKMPLQGLKLQCE
jgi:hypothetical protein